MKENKFKVGDVDPEYILYLSLFKWRKVKYGPNTYYKTDLPRFMGVKRSFFMHQMIMYWLVGCRRIKGREIDHIDGNGLNNKTENLRIVSSSQNKWNKKKTRGSSRFKGVSFSPVTGRWYAQINKNKKKYSLGGFNSEARAAAAYDTAAKKLFGAHAKLNLVDYAVPFR